jgi:hypothetical protein
VKSRWSLSHAMGVKVTSRMYTISLSFTHSLHDRVSARVRLTQQSLS